jgi:hypothetical protein
MSVFAPPPSVACLGRLLLVLLLPGAVGGSEPSAAQIGWEQGARLFFNEAARTFSVPAATPEQVLGRAVMLLGVQPRTESNLDEARTLLAGLVDSAGSDDAGIAARYYLARLEQLHAEDPDLAKARTHYRELVARHSAHLFGQLARLKLAMLALYDTAHPAPLSARLPEAEEWGSGITDPVVRCDYHYMMSRALAREDGREAQRLEHLLAMEATGKVIRDPTRSLMLVEIGEMARAVGRRELAVRAYRQFLQEYPRDARGAAVRSRLAETEAGR